ncbi:hypothetical protein A2U01_0023163 [Trifolium medium]|uniref:Uncharacterized protein n=1 Tax=Trifolium medium TaxID=97028 RepID=A0A392NQK0_9FABA|nr:hypothetical protein [Trifolium medium]
MSEQFNQELSLNAVPSSWDPAALARDWSQRFMLHFLVLCD